MGLPFPTKSDYGTVDDLTPTEANNIGKNLDALVDGSAIIGNGGGTANAQTVTSSLAFTALTNGLKISYKPTLTNTNAMTVALDGMVAKSVLKRSAGVLVSVVAGDVVANVQADLTFVTQNDAWILEIPAQITDGQLSANVPLKNAENMLTAANTFTATSGVRRKNPTDVMGTRLIRISAAGGGVSFNLDDDLVKDDSGNPSWEINFDISNDRFTILRERIAIVDFNNSGEMLAGVIPSGRLKTATGVASSATGSAIDVVMNDYSFAPSITSTTNNVPVSAIISADPGNTLGRLHMDGLASSVSTVRWRYMTASDDPAVYVSYLPSGEIIGVWMSDDPLPFGEVGIVGFTQGGVKGTSIMLPRADLSIIVAGAGIKAADISKGKKKATTPDKESFRILWEAFKNPADEIIKRGKIVGGQLQAK